ncbi:MAG: FAD-dependent oxidoreductase, partial [Ktedonobacterales bacterium]
LIQRPDRLIPKDEPEASAVVRQRLEAEGVTVLTSADVRGVALRAGQKVLDVQTAQGRVEVAADEILVATGRAPNVERLGLEAAGVAYDPRAGIAVDRHLRTSNPRVYAAGDVTGGYRFTHAAAKQARVAVQNVLLPISPSNDERVMPWATFTEPEVAHVGLTEAQARAKQPNGLTVVTLPMTAVDRAVTDDETAGFVKLVATPKGKLLGATIVGPHAGDLINELAVAMQRGISLGQLAATTHVYPTIGLAIQQAAGTFSQRKAAQSGLVKLLRRFA